MASVGIRRKYWRFIDFATRRIQRMVVAQMNKINSWYLQPDITAEIYTRFICRLSTNPAITMTDVSNNPMIQWAPSSLSTNTSITARDVLDHPEIRWNLDHLAMNPNMSVCDIITISRTMQRPINMFYLSQNRSISINDVLNNPELDWDFEMLSGNPAIKFRDVLNNSTLQWNYTALSRNPSVTMQHVLDHPSIPWDIYWLSHNPSITLQNVIDHYALRWDITQFSCNRSLTFTDVCTHTYMKWHFPRVELCATMNMDNIRDILMNIDVRYVHAWPWIPYTIYNLSCNPSVSLNDMLSNPDIEWDTTALAGKTDYHRYVQHMHNRYPDIVIAMVPLRLPVYVILWILDTCDEYFMFECLYELTKIRMIESVMRRYNRTHTLSC